MNLKSESSNYPVYSVRIPYLCVIKNNLGDMYSRAQSGPGAPSASGQAGGMPPTGPGNSASKAGSDYSGYGAGYGIHKKKYIPKF